MCISSLQQQIDRLQRTTDTILHSVGGNGEFYADDFTRLNREIYSQVIALSRYRGETPEQEASLCMSVLMGFSIMMYANPEDEQLKQTILERSVAILKQLPDSQLKDQLHTCCCELLHQ